MIKLTLMPIARTVEVESGTALLDAIRKAGVEISSPCGGQHLCGKCKVRLDNQAQVEQTTSGHLTPEELSQGIRLACEVVVEEDMRIFLLEDFTRDARILEGELLNQAQPSPAVRIKKHRSTYQFYYGNRPPVDLEKWPADHAPKGVALDVGTTTLVATLMDLQTGRELATASSLNPQQQYGYDVMTRIHMASTRQGLSQLRSTIADALNGLCRQLCKASYSQPEEIVDAVVGGNTTMLQIAAGIDPSPLGVLPFNVGIDNGRTYPANRFGLMLNSAARVYVPPVAHAFVGSDISAGLLSIDFFKQDSSLLFIDIGTNGEMALCADGITIVTSTAAGPAFEGMGISHGMRAAPGAIETVWADEKFLSIRTIDDQPAKGICGSGLMDLMACLIRQQAIDSGGRLNNPADSDKTKGPLSERYGSFDGTAAIMLTDKIAFTQKDIRQFQLAKGAVQTGIEMLLSNAGMSADRLEKIVIAGGFGYHLREENLRTIGFIPKAFSGHVEFAGNTCRTGCALMLTDVTTRGFLQDQMKRVNHISIAESPDFQTRFIHNLSLGN